MMETLIEFDVVGTPMPQGSKRAFVANGRAVVKESSSGSHAQWRNAVADKAREIADQFGRLEGALDVALTFRHPMPKSRSKRVQLDGVAPKTTAPDSDKLARAVLDGLMAGGLVRDDALVWRLVVEKWESVGWCGVHVVIAS